MATRLERFVQPLGATADGVVAVNARQRIVHWNNGLERLLGYTQADVLNRTCYEVLAGRCLGKLWCFAGCRVHRMALRQRLPDSFDLLTSTKDGRETWLNVSTIVLQTAREPVLVHMMRDASRQKRNEEAIRACLAMLGIRQPSAPDAQGITEGAQTGACDDFSSLTRREVEILGLLAQGLTTAEIARRRGVSFFTVRNHIHNSLRKLHVSSRAQAVAVMFGNGLLSPHGSSSSSE